MILSIIIITILIKRTSIYYIKTYIIFNNKLNRLEIMKIMRRSKNWLFTLLIVTLIAPAYAQINTPSSATVPFGSKIVATSNPYGYGIIPATLPTGSYNPTSNAYGKSQDAYSAYNSWKTKYVQACGSQYRVLFDDNTSTVSEGIGYGMLLSAYAADKALFDGLWTYYKTNSNNNGLMNWKISGCTGPSGTNGATDADLDAAMALIVASKQWPTATNPYTYSNEANTLITAIKTYEIQTSSFQAINGDGWGMANNCRNPSYQSPAYYRQFATQVPSQASTWNNAVTAAYTLLNVNRNTSTGLVSNWSDQNGSANNCGSGNIEYGYDACRNPWRMAVDVLWTGNSTAQTNFCVPIASYINGKGASNASGPVPQSGGSGTVNATFVSTFAAGICGATSSYQNIMNSMYTQTVNTVDGSGYFGNTLRVISLFVQTGNFWNPSTLSACTVPSAAGSISGSTSVCANTTNLTYSISSVTNATGYTWTIPSGATITGGSGTNSITVTMGTSNGTVKVTPTNTCGSGTASSINVTVNATVTPSVTINTGTTNICAGSSITLSASATNGGANPTYQWKKGGNAISGATSVNYTTTTAANNDSYTVTMTSNVGCPSTPSVTSAAKVITVNPTVTPSVTINAGTTTICAGSSITLSAAPTNGGTSPTYQWEKGGTAISGATSVNYTTTSATNNDSYTVTMTSNASCLSTTSTTSAAKVITVNAKVTPTISISVSPSSTIYTGQSFTFTANYSNGGSTPTFQWRKNGNVISGTTNSSFTTTTLTTNDALTAVITSNATCLTTTTANSNSIVVTVNPNPGFDSNVSGPTSATSNQTSVSYSVSNQTGMTYTWSVPAGATIVSGQGTNSIVVNFGTSSGNVTLIEKNTGGQTSTLSLPVSVGTTTPIFIPMVEHSIKIYPNPCAEKITIELSESTQTDISVTLIDAIGNIVLSTTQTYSGKPIDIEMSYASGMYQLILTWDVNKYIQKIIKY
jgi:endo-1,4-beta-D-glucanase Y